MRTASIRIDAEQEWFGPLDRVLTDEEAVAREAIHNLRRTRDGSVLALYEYAGPTDRLEDHLARYLEAETIGREPEVIGWQLSEGEGSLYVYQHHRPNADITRQFELLDEHRLLLDPPIRFTASDDLRVTLIGPEDQFGEAYETSTRDLHLTLDRIGSFCPDAEELLSALTDQELEVLRTATSLGYFENPRQANYDDVASAVGCSKATIGQHIRNAQAKLLGELLPDQYEQRPAP